MPARLRPERPKNKTRHLLGRKHDKNAEHHDAILLHANPPFEKLLRYLGVGDERPWFRTLGSSACWLKRIRHHDMLLRVCRNAVLVGVGYVDEEGLSKEVVGRIGDEFVDLD